MIMFVHEKNTNLIYSVNCLSHMHIRLMNIQTILRLLSCLEKERKKKTISQHIQKSSDASSLPSRLKRKQMDFHFLAKRKVPKGREMHQENKKG